MKLQGQLKMSKETRGVENRKNTEEVDGKPWTTGSDHAAEY